jgi:NAD(P)-dependent dehydrogenase (short-subunit alcohol dehydrogenase family)
MNAAERFAEIGWTVHMIRKGRDNRRRKLTEEAEQFVRAYYEPAPPGRHCRPGQWTARAIARRFDVSDQAIHQLIRRMGIDARGTDRR